MLEPDREIVRADGEFDRDLAVKLDRKGRLAFEHGHLAKAETLLQQAALADAGYGPAHNNLGLVHFEKGDLYSAAWSFERAAQAMPERPEPLNNLGIVYESAGRLEQAISQYALAHELDPNNPEFLGNLLRARRVRGDLDASMEEQLRHLLLIETRPEWREWAQDQLVLFLPKEIRRLSDDNEPEEIEVVPSPTPDSPAPSENEKSSERQSSTLPPPPSPSAIERLPAGPPESADPPLRIRVEGE